MFSHTKSKKPKWSHNRFGMEFDVRWGDLSTFNSERSRGILHTPEMIERMEAKQLLYNEIIASDDEYAIWTCEIDGIPPAEIRDRLFRG